MVSNFFISSVGFYILTVVLFDQYYITLSQNDSDVTPGMILFHPNKYSMLIPVLPYTANTPTPGPTFQYGGSYLHNAVQVFQQQDTVTGSPRDEL